ncbi:MAG: cysteine hydrolase [Pseudomonadota bacterium]
MFTPHHPSGLNSRVVAKVVERRGRLHAFESLNPATTALVVLDLMAASMERDNATVRIVPTVNKLAGRVRAAGGVVAWVTVQPGDKIDPIMVAIVGHERARAFHEQAQPDNPLSKLWPELDVAEGDIHAVKLGASAFFPGKSDLHEQLYPRSIDTILIAGTVTNVCCESSARDAVELGYRVVMVSDAMAGHAFGLHEATLTTFYRIFGDVRPSDEIMRLIGGSQ